ncbi:MAG: hypothetical protein EF806_06330 [Candidatus Methanoliparum thermophilum]|uniref:Uncharacterized protein n=1 Tax=Methanoliparum thermophilum TaxID=2491083 RepID=A0A520KQU5_METT2|nr:MAG: hypothetical protein EF806_06330 [Candidatus Methanoliparum thermophilum]
MSLRDRNQCKRSYGTDLFYNRGSLTREVVFCLADRGSRQPLKLNDDEMIVGIPFERLESVLRGLDGISKRRIE